MSDNYLDRYIQARDIAQFRCPTCDGYIPNNDNPGAYPGALSRRDNKTEVCSECGQVEAIEDFLAARDNPFPAFGLSDRARKLLGGA